jgi:hypothetical protein
VASALVWIVVTAVVPVWVHLILLLAWAGSVMAWRSGVLLWWRFGARPLAGSVRVQVLRALVPAACLRGRQQPLVWRSRRLRGAVVAADNRNLIWADGLVEQIVSGQLSDDQASALAVHALGTAGVRASKLVAAISLFTIPWRMLARLAGPRLGQGRPPVLGRIVSGVRWVTLAIAASDLYQRGQWAALPFLAGVAIAILTTEPWLRRWHHMFDELGEQHLARHGFGETYARLPGPHSCMRVRAGIRARSL